MVNSSNSSSGINRSTEPTPIFSQKVVERCHVFLPDMPKAVSAVNFEDKFYAYVKLFPSVEAAQRGADRLREKGNLVILTRVPKGIVLWVHEPDAQIAQKSEVK